MPSSRRNGRPPALAAKKVLSFTSDETRRLQDEGVESVKRWRLARLHRLAIGEGGEIIFATPEAVAWLLLHPEGGGLGDVGPANTHGGFQSSMGGEKRNILKGHTNHTAARVSVLHGR